MPPIRFGMKNTVLKNVVPFNAFVNNNARKKEKKFMVITETMVNFIVNHKALKKFSSFVNALT